MTRDETKKIMITMQAAYPNYKPIDKTASLDIWTGMLNEYSYHEVSIALAAYITSDTSGFAPSIGQLIGIMQRTSQPEALNEMEAWALVSNALRNGYYGAEREFANLPQLVQKAVGTPANLRNWSQSELDSIESVVQSNFLRTYRIVVARASETERMPKEVRNKISALNTPVLEDSQQVVSEDTQDYVESSSVPGNIHERLNELLKEGADNCESM